MRVRARTDARAGLEPCVYPAFADFGIPTFASAAGQLGGAGRAVPPGWLVVMVAHGKDVAFGFNRVGSVYVRAGGRACVLQAMQAVRAVQAVPPRHAHRASTLAAAQA